MSGFASFGEFMAYVPNRRDSRQQCRLAQAPTSKHQAPKKSRNRNTKNQAPNTNEIPSSKLQTAARTSSLELGAWLVFGAWCLVLGTWRFFGIGGLGFGAFQPTPARVVSPRLQSCRVFTS